MTEQGTLESGSKGGIYVECNADVATCDEESLQVCEKGMRFHTRFPMAEGNDYHIELRCCGDGKGWWHFGTDATVVECVEHGEGCYAVTLFFLDLPEDLREAINSDVLIEAKLPDRGSRSRPA